MAPAGKRPPSSRRLRPRRSRPLESEKALPVVDNLWVGIASTKLDDDGFLLDISGFITPS